MGSSSSVEKKNENRQEKKRLDSVTPGGVESGDADTFLETATVPEIKEAFRKLQSTYVEVQNSLMAEKATNAVLSGKVKGLEQLVHELQGDAVRLKADTSIPAGGPNLTPADEEGRKETERAAQLCACASGGNLDELQALLKTGINVNVVDYGKRTALHIACEEGHLEIVEALIGEGADINTKDRWGTTPLKAALTNVHNDVANVLKENGAVVEDKLLRSPSTITALFNERSRTFKQFVTGLEEFCRITLTDPIPLPGLCLFLFKEYGVNIAVNQLLFTEVVAAAKPSSESDDLKKWDTKKACLKTFKQLSSASHISVFSSIVGLLDKNKQLGHIVTREALRVAMAGSDTSDTVSMCKLAMAQGAISNWGAFVKMLDELCHEVMLGPNEGNNAAYIPNLAEGMVDPELFSVSVCTVEGQQFVFGDEEAFTLQSCGKPFIYAAALEEKGDEEVHKYVGTEPSGRQFDNFELANGKPFNPVTNAGCLVTGSMYKSTAENSERLSSYMDLVQDLAGNQDVKLDKKVFKSEQSTAYKNYAIANLLAAEGCFPDHIKKHEDLAKEIEFYLKSCSVSMNSRACATIAATFANWGTNPLTGKKIMGWETVRSTLQVCYSCGMYNSSGNWACTVGLPAKSGVSGAIYVVVPGVLGLCVRSPRLDSTGNSVRGQIFARRFAERFRWSVLDLTYRAKDQMAMAF